MTLDDRASHQPVTIAFGHDIGDQQIGDKLRQVHRRIDILATGRASTCFDRQ
jgi:hypothetical protein